MKTLADLTPAEEAEAAGIVAALQLRGYAPRERFNELAPGVRVRHHGHQWSSAYTEGTGVVVAITERDPSSWSQSWGAPDIEMVVAFDEPTLPEMSRLTTLAQYHVQVVTAPNSPSTSEEDAR